MSQKMTYLTIDDFGRMVAMRGWSGKRVVIENERHLVETMEPGFMCSSAIDFPEDYTDDAHVINMCHFVWGGRGPMERIAEFLEEMEGEHDA